MRPTREEDDNSCVRVKVLAGLGKLNPGGSRRRYGGRRPRHGSGGGLKGDEQGGGGQPNGWVGDSGVAVVLADELLWLGWAGSEVRAGSGWHDEAAHHQPRWWGGGEGGSKGRGEVMMIMVELARALGLAKGRLELQGAKGTRRS